MASLSPSDRGAATHNLPLHTNTTTATIDAGAGTRTSPAAPPRPQTPGSTSPRAAPRSSSAAFRSGRRRPRRTLARFGRSTSRRTRRRRARSGRCSSELQGRVGCVWRDWGSVMGFEVARFVGRRLQNTRVLSKHTTLHTILSQRHRATQRADRIFRLHPGQQEEVKDVSDCV